MEISVYEEAIREHDLSLYEFVATNIDLIPDFTRMGGLTSSNNNEPKWVKLYGELGSISATIAHERGLEFLGAKEAKIGRYLTSSEARDFTESFQMVLWLSLLGINGESDSAFELIIYADSLGFIRESLSLLSASESLTAALLVWPTTLKGEFVYHLASLDAAQMLYEEYTPEHYSSEVSLLTARPPPIDTTSEKQDYSRNHRGVQVWCAVAADLSWWTEYIRTGGNWADYPIDRDVIEYLVTKFESKIPIIEHTIWLGFLIHAVSVDSLDAVKILFPYRREEHFYGIYNSFLWPKSVPIFEYLSGNGMDFDLETLSKEWWEQWSRYGGMTPETVKYVAARWPSEFDKNKATITQQLLLYRPLEEILPLLPLLLTTKNVEQLRSEYHTEYGYLRVNKTLSDEETVTVIEALAQHNVRLRSIHDIRELVYANKPRAALALSNVPLAKKPSRAKRKRREDLYELRFIDSTVEGINLVANIIRNNLVSNEVVEEYISSIDKRVLGVIAAQHNDEISTALIANMILKGIVRKEVAQEYIYGLNKRTKEYKVLNEALESI